MTPIVKDIFLSYSQVINLARPQGPRQKRSRDLKRLQQNKTPAVSGVPGSALEWLGGPELSEEGFVKYADHKPISGSSNSRQSTDTSVTLKAPPGLEELEAVALHAW